MQTLAPKRRKISRQNSKPSEAESAPPPDLPSVVSAISSRPSFASPTRASLERFNPEILRPRESSPVKSRQGKPWRAGHDTEGSQPRIPRRAQAVVNQSGLRDKSTSFIDGAASSNKSGGRLRSPTRDSGGYLSAKPIRSPVRPSPRLLPFPAPEEENADSPLDRILRSFPEEAVPEPELPSTPDLPDSALSTPPTGIHATPTKLSMLRKAPEPASSSPKKPSPLKTLSVATRGARPVHGPNKAASQVLPSPQPETPAQSTSQLRGLGTIDPNADKKRKRDALLAEVAELEHDLDIATTENERIRQCYLSKQVLAEPGNKSDIIDLLRRRLLPDDKAVLPSTSTSLLQAALNPIGLLPFGKKVSTVPTPSVADKGDGAEPSPLSHHPTLMTAEEALPYLQIFTPFSFKSHIFPLPIEAGEPLLQLHSITCTSTSPPGFFSAQIEMTVNTSTQAVVDLRVTRLEPAATAELQAFLERLLSKTKPVSSGVTRNVSILTWAFGEWFRVALRRARTWSRLENELGKKQGLVTLVHSLRIRKKALHGLSGRSRKLQSEEEAPDVIATGDLLPFMGRTSMDFDIPLLSAPAADSSGSKLRVEWRMEFDWAGEAKSRIRVLVDVPAKWHSRDARGRLSGIPAMFDSLLEAGEEPVAAVRATAVLLAGGSS